MIDTSLLPYDLEKIKQFRTKEELFDFIPALMDYPSFQQSLPIELPRVFELIVLLYSPRGLLVTRHSTAKVDAAQYFGYKVIGDKIQDKIVADMLSGKNKNFNMCVISYIRIQHAPKFAKFVIFDMKLYKSMEEFVDDESSEKDKDLFNLINSLETEVSTLENELIKNDPSLEIREELYAEVERIALGIRPEDIAEKMAAGEDPLPGVHPYGERYKFEIDGNRSNINPLTDD